MATCQPRLAVNEAVVYAELDNEAVLLNVETGIYFGLNDIGTLIWKLLEQSTSQEDIVTNLLDEYDVDPAKLRTDVNAFVDQLIDRQLITAVA